MKKMIISAWMVVIFMSIFSGCTFTEGVVEDLKEDKEWTEENAAKTDGNDAGNPVKIPLLETETDKTDETNETNETNKMNEPDEPDRTDEKYQIGDTITMTTENGSQIAVTLTDWGSGYETLVDAVILHVGYEIENTGKDTVTVGNALFNIYADDYIVEQTYPDQAVISAELSAGRKVSGYLYGKVNPDSVSSIEVELGDTVFVVKGETDISGGNGQASIPEEDGQTDLDPQAASYIGTWWDTMNQRCAMEITYDGDGNYSIEIDWFDGANDVTRWFFSGIFDSDTGAISYTGSSMGEFYTEDGDLEKEILYDDGEGILFMGDDGLLYWDDYKENAGSSCAFERGE